MQKECTALQAIVLRTRALSFPAMAGMYVHRLPDFIHNVYSRTGIRYHDIRLRNIRSVILYSIRVELYRKPRLFVL